MRKIKNIFSLKKKKKNSMCYNIMYVLLFKNITINDRKIIRIGKIIITDERENDRKLVLTCY